MLAASCRDHRTVEAFPASFVGVGIELHGDDASPRVVRVLAGGPAEKAGVQPGDDVVAIDGESTKGRSLGEVVMALRGAPESQVELTVERGSQRIIFVLRRLPMAKEGGDYRTAKRGF
jgi:carboxyl-terminal processing protease